MPSPYKAGGRIQPHRERAKAEKALALKELNATIEPLQVDPPEWVPEAARAAWIDLHPLLPHEVVRQCDAPLFALTCQLVAKQMTGDLSAAGATVLLTCFDKLGMTPAGRRKLTSMTGAGAGDAAGDRFARFTD